MAKISEETIKKAKDVVLSLVKFRREYGNIFRLEDLVRDYYLSTRETVPHDLRVAVLAIIVTSGINQSAIYEDYIPSNDSIKETLMNKNNWKKKKNIHIGKKCEYFDGSFIEWSEAISFDRNKINERIGFSNGKPFLYW